VIGTALIPMNARSIRPWRISCPITVLTVLDGTAKPMPTFPPVPESPVSIWEFTPITSPAPFRSGPPELPWLMDASVWMTWSIV